MIEPSLANLFERMQIGSSDKKVVQDKYGINSLQELIKKRFQLYRATKKDRIFHGPRLIAAINYIMTRKKTQTQIPLDQIITSSMSLSDSFEYFIACTALANILAKRKAKLEKAQVAAGKPKDNKKKKPESRWVSDDDDWKIDPGLNNESDSDFDDCDPEKIRCTLGLDREDSAWYLDVSDWMVVLKAWPTAMRVPAALFQKLYPHQRSGLEWLSGLSEEGTGGILGVEMGMGKTMQTLVFLVCLLHSKTIRNALVVCPPAILNTAWKSEAWKVYSCFGRTCPVAIKVVSSEIPMRERTKALKQAKYCSADKPHLILTGYSQFEQTKGLPIGFKNYKKGFDYIFLDEGQKVKSKKSQRTVNLKKILTKATRVVALSGTPILNNLQELYQLLNLSVGEHKVGKWEDFNAKYVKPIEAARERDASRWALERGKARESELKNLIQPYLLMRKRNEHLKGIVPVNHQFDVWTKLSQKQRQVYQDFLKSDDMNAQAVASGNTKCVLPVIGELRQLCGHPLMKHKDNVSSHCHALGVEKVIEMSPKLDVLVNLATKWKREQHRMLIFSHFLEILDILEFVFSELDGFKACRIDGKTSSMRKEYLINDFNSSESQFNVLLMTIQTGGEGFTLTGASRCVVFDPVWNQAGSDQAVARICRPGQTKECESICLIAAGTVEEKMLGKQIYKGCLDRIVLGETPRANNGSSLSRLYNKGELSQLFELAPKGSCETIDRMKESGDFNLDVLGKCSMNLSHKAIVGISRRCDIFNATTSSKKGKLNEEEDLLDDNNDKGSSGMMDETADLSSATSSSHASQPHKKPKLLSEESAGCEQQVDPIETTTNDVSVDVTAKDAAVEGAPGCFDQVAAESSNTATVRSASSGVSTSNDPQPVLEEEMPCDDDVEDPIMAAGYACAI